MCKISIKESLKYGFTKTIDKFWMFLKVFIIIAILGLVLYFITDYLSLRDDKYVFILVSILNILIINLLILGWINISSKVYNEGNFTLADLFSQYNLLFQFLILNFIYFFVVMIGLSLLILPGLIIGTRLSFYPCLLFERKSKFLDSFRMSWELTKGETWHLMGFIFISALIEFLSIILFLVGSILVIPMVNLAYFFTYKSLIRNYNDSRDKLGQINNKLTNLNDGEIKI